MAIANYYPYLNYHACTDRQLRCKLLFLSKLLSRLKISVSTYIYRYLDFTNISDISVDIFT